MLRQKWGSVVCPSCGNLVGVNDERCFTCGRWNPGLWGFAPLLSRLGRDLGFTQFVMWSCIILYLLTLASDVQGVSMGGFNFLAPSAQSLFLFGASGVIPVFRYGRWWTFLSAGWLHAGVLHILFNMMWIRQLAPATSEMYGASRMVIIYTIAGVTGFAASTLSGAFIPVLGGAGFTVGASAPIFGLLGALVYYGRRTGSSIVGDQAKSWAITLFIFGFIFRGVDNWAHLGGFAGGYAAAKFLDPLQPERLDHLVGALVCLALTGLAITFSIVNALGLFRL
ncbi:MAG TPA: rhomboid family intramembrane serine protease, partial [Terriglobia bacterium]|nr:rhomboid family intramembrane serine protease [Terriglobia bacterium]